jgi:hypothetical protein
MDWRSESSGSTTRASRWTAMPMIDLPGSSASIRAIERARPTGTVMTVPREEDAVAQGQQRERRLGQFVVRHGGSSPRGVAPAGGSHLSPHRRAVLALAAVGRRNLKPFPAASTAEPVKVAVGPAQTRALRAVRSAREPCYGRPRGSVAARAAGRAARRCEGRARRSSAARWMLSHETGYMGQVSVDHEDVPRDSQ